MISSIVKERAGERLIVSATAQQQARAIIRGATVELEP